jgi:23S rRNA (pseudouridine1915-N3)-methyltransferase
VLAVGRLRPPFTDDVEHYAKLLRRQARVEIVEVREDEATRAPDPRAARMSCCSTRGPRAVLGGLRAFLEERRQAGRDVCFVLGGRSGTALGRHDAKLSLGPMTLPHQLARSWLLEQLFRGHKILAGEPYHH